MAVNWPYKKLSIETDNGMMFIIKCQLSSLFVQDGNKKGLPKKWTNEFKQSCLFNEHNADKLIGRLVKAYPKAVDQ